MAASQSCNIEEVVDHMSTLNQIRVVDLMSTMNQIGGFFARFVGLPSNLPDNVASKLPDGVMQSRWESMETDDSFIFYFDLPGLSKQNVVLGVGKTNKDNILVVYGKVGRKSPSERDRTYQCFTDLPCNCRVSGIKAEMKCGVLKVVIPKMETTFFRVKVE